MDARLYAFRFSPFLAAAVLAACGGGGGGGGSTLPPMSAPSAPGGTNAAPASVAISIAIPSASTTSSRRRTRYVSAGTKSATVTFGANQQTTNCTSTCSLVVNVAPGSVTFAIRLFDDLNGGGHVLSTGQTTATIAANQNNVVNVTFEASVASLALALGSAAVTAGSPATIPVIVTAKDAAGYTIVGSDSFLTPIALSNDDASGATALSTNVVTAPGATVNLTYNGSASLGSARIAASIAGTAITATPVTLSVNAAPANSPPPNNPPPANVPAHVTTWYYYGLNDMNSAIPAAWMAAHADFAEGDAADSVALLLAFKNAGGKYTVSYTDPAYSAYCYAPFTQPAGRCEGPMGGLVSGDESAWLHGADGSRVHRYMDSHFQYQEALNPAAQSARDAYRRGTAASVAAAPSLDYFFADDSGGVFTGSDGTQLSGLLYGFNAPATEISGDAAFITAQQQMVAAAARPVFINGATPYTLMPSYNGTFLKSPNVAGQNFEGCYGDYNGLVGDDSSGGPRWTNMSNALLAVYGYGTRAVCMNVAAATPANRIYVLASWWMTYDEARSIIVPHALAPDGFSVLPEFDIVPRQPRATATASIAALRAPGGAYVREFAACFQAGISIGPCAAAVNPSASAVATPATTGRYTISLAVDDRSAYTGGKAAWTGSVPATLAARSAVVLR